MGIAVCPVCDSLNCSCTSRQSQIRDLSGDGQMVKEILSRGQGVFPVDCPVEDSHITAHWR